MLPNMSNAKLIDLISRTATRQDLIDLLHQHDAEIVSLKLREDILVSALAEIKATIEGTSEQPISHIIEGCIAELSALNSENSD